MPELSTFSSPPPFNIPPAVNPSDALEVGRRWGCRVLNDFSVCSIRSILPPGSGRWSDLRLAANEHTDLVRPVGEEFSAMAVDIPNRGDIVGAVPGLGVRWRSCDCPLASRYVRALFHSPPPLARCSVHDAYGSVLSPRSHVGLANPRFCGPPLHTQEGDLMYVASQWAPRRKLFAMLVIVRPGVPKLPTVATRTRRSNGLLALTQ